MCFIAMGSALKKPFVELIPIGEKLNAKRSFFLKRYFENSHFSFDFDFNEIFRYLKVMKRLVAHFKESQEELMSTSDDFLKSFANLPFKLMQDALIPN